MGHHRVEGKTKPYRYHIDQFSELQHLIHKVMEYGEAMGLEMIQVITKTPREFPSLGSNRTKPGASLPASATLRPDYGFSGSQPPNYEGTNDQANSFLR
jgi:hypothetical protein